MQPLDPMRETFGNSPQLKMISFTLSFLEYQKDRTFSKETKLWDYSSALNIWDVSEV